MCIVFVLMAFPHPSFLHLIHSSVYLGQMLGQMCYESVFFLPLWSQVCGCC